MKKLVAVMMGVVIMLCGAAVAGEVTEDSGEDALIQSAIEVLKEHWASDVYSDFPLSDGYLEIKWVRVVYIKPDVTAPLADGFKDMDCFIEFFLLSDTFGSAPYYSHAGIDECVTVSNDGVFEVVTRNPLDMYRSLTYQLDFSGIVESISDRGSDFNSTFYLGQEAAA